MLKKILEKTIDESNKGKFSIEEINKKIDYYKHKNQQISFRYKWNLKEKTADFVINNNIQGKLILFEKKLELYVDCPFYLMPLVKSFGNKLLQSI